MGQKYFSSMYCAKKGRKCKHLQGVLTRIGQGYSELAGTPCIRKEMYSYTELKKEVWEYIFGMYSITFCFCSGHFCNELTFGRPQKIHYIPL